MVPRATALGGDPRGSAPWAGSGAETPALPWFLASSRLLLVVAGQLPLGDPRQLRVIGKPRRPCRDGSRQIAARRLVILIDQFLQAANRLVDRRRKRAVLAFE